MIIPVVLMAIPAAGFALRKYWPQISGVLVLGTVGGGILLALIPKLLSYAEMFHKNVASPARSRLLAGPSA